MNYGSLANEEEESKPRESFDSEEPKKVSTMDSLIKNTKLELTTTALWRAAFGEFLASLLFIIGAIAPVLGFNFKPAVPAACISDSISWLHIGFGVGMTVALLAHIFWDISGGNFNPAVSIALLTARKISPIRFALYLIAQMAGSVVGAALLYAYTPYDFRAGLGVLSLNAKITLVQGFFVEFTTTFIFIMVIMSTTDSAKNNPGFLPPLAIGLAIFLGHLVSIPYTGACMNPIRQFGPAIVMNTHKNHWLYWLAPLSAGITAPLVYEFILTEKQQSVPVEAANGELNIQSTERKDTNI